MQDSHADKVSCASKHPTNTSAVANVACALRLQKELVRVRSGTSCPSDAARKEQRQESHNRDPRRTAEAPGRGNPKQAAGGAPQGSPSRQHKQHKGDSKGEVIAVMARGDRTAETSPPGRSNETVTGKDAINSRSTSV